MGWSKTACFGVALAAAAAYPVAAQEAHERHQHPGDAIHFPVSCRPEVQADFNSAVATLHSFGYEEARRAFQAIARRDPDCGMVHWGVAMTYWHLLWAPQNPEEVAGGRAAAEQAAQVGAGTDRERAYIAAIGEFYRDAGRRPEPERAIAYRNAMERLVARFPDDDEARIFHALAIRATAPPIDSTYAVQRQAAAILNQLLPEHPRHPGIAHYLIHSFDYPELAELALPAARIYAELAPESPHALHMPTHIFTRRGLWQESIKANQACERVAQARMARTNPGSTAYETQHCRDYLVYAYLQQGNDEAARRVMEKMQSARRFDVPNDAVGYAMAAAPARYALERRDWKAAAELALPEATLPWERYAYAKGTLHFANAVGAARSSDPTSARAAVARLSALHTQLTANPPAGAYDWVGQVKALELAASGWVAFAEGRAAEAERLLRSAAELEEAVGKHPVTPGSVLPAREQLGDLLLELGRPADALGAYEAALADAPRRFNGLVGAARAARAAGIAEKAAGYYRAVVELAGSAPSPRREVAEAKSFLATVGTDDQRAKSSP